MIAQLCDRLYLEWKLVLNTQFRTAGGFLPIFSLASPLTKPLVSLPTVRDTRNRRE